MAETARVRAFNRVVTRRIGALEAEYLSRGRPMGASRALWEIAAGHDDMRSLRARMDLDAGYLTRLVQSLERDGLVVVEPHPDDRRVRAVRLTSAGEAELQALDRASDELADSMLAHLSAAQRDRLVGAMGEVERLLTAGLVRVAVEDPRTDVARYCLQSYFAEIGERFENGYDPGIGIYLEPEDMEPPKGLLLLARLDGEAIGCGVLWRHGPDVADAKRMWVAPRARGLGVGRRLLAELEHHARETGVKSIRLETNRALREAIALYRASGYREVAPFNDEPHAHHWFEKPLR